MYVNIHILSLFYHIPTPPVLYLMYILPLSFPKLFLPLSPSTFFSPPSNLLPFSLFPPPSSSYSKVRNLLELARSLVFNLTAC